MSTIKSLTKSQANPDPKNWEQLKIDIIERDISKKLSMKLTMNYFMYQ